MKLIIGAMFEELETSIKFYKAKKTNDKICNVYKSKDVLFCVTGVGLVNAAAHLSYVLCNYNIYQILNIGTSGACDLTLKQNDVIVIDKIYCSVADAVIFGYEYGQVPKMPKYYETNKANFDLQKPIKNLASSDIFIHSQSQLDLFVNKINNKISVLDMECFAYAQTAYIYNKPISVIKIISDVIGLTDANNVQFLQFIKIAGDEILKIIKNFI